MIDIIVSNECEHCGKQIEKVSKSFSEHEYRIIQFGSPEFQSLTEKEIVDGVPFVIVRDQSGTAKYAALGLHEDTELREIDRRESIVPFNLRRQRKN